MDRREDVNILMVCTVPTARSGIPIVIFNLIRSLRRNQKDIGRIGYVAINEPSSEIRSFLKKNDIELVIIKLSLIK